MLTEQEIGSLKRSIMIADAAVDHIEDLDNRLEALLILQSAVRAISKLEAATNPQPNP